MLITAVTLIALPDTERNAMRARISAASPGTVVGSDHRAQVRHDIYYQRDFLEVGPENLPSAAAVFGQWQTPHVVTLTEVILTMVAMDIADGPPNPQWATPSRDTVHRWLAAHDGMIVWAERW
jgi:hypothetical protein